jgi:hypothetical protein
MHRTKWIWVDILDGIACAVLVGYYHVPWYVGMGIVLSLAFANYFDGLTNKHGGE